MIQHIFKLLWSRRKDYIWIFLEQILVFVVLLYCFTLIFGKVQQYFDGGNLSVKNVCVIGIIADNKDMTDDERAEFWNKVQMVEDRVLSSEYVKTTHKGYYSVPLNRSAALNFQDSLTYDGKKYKFYIKTSDDNFPMVFHPQILTGTWYKDESFVDGIYPAVVTTSLVKKLNLTEPLGARLYYKGHDFRITGVIPDFKTMVYDEPTATAILATSAFKGTKFDDNKEMAVLVKEGQMKNFINLFWKEADSAFPSSGHQPIAEDLEDANKDFNINTYLTLMLTIVPTLFLMVFAFLGTFSLMYRQSKRSIGEYGLRIALGCTKKRLQAMVFTQSCILTLGAIIIGCVAAVNIYLVAFSEISIVLFLGAIATTIIVMFSFAAISVFYPAYLASKIEPAIALKLEE